MLLKKHIILMLFVTTMVTGCFSFNPQPGMTLAQVNSAAYVPCPGSMNINEQHLVFVGNLNEDSTIRVYRTAAYERFKRADGPCAKNLYFQNGVLISDDRVRQIIDEKKKILANKIEEMRKFIQSNRLQVLEKFRNTSDQNFKIYINDKKEYFYSINYSFVTANEVSNQIRQFNEESKREIEQKNRLEEQKKQEEVKKEQQINRQKLNQL